MSEKRGRKKKQGKPSEGREPAAGRDEREREEGKPDLTPPRAPDREAERAEDEDTARLVTRFQAGDERAFDTIYRRYFDRVHKYVNVALHDWHESEDATQQVFLQMFEALPRYEARAGKPFRAWLFKIARNYVIAFLRKHDRLQVEDPETIDRLREEEQRREGTGGEQPGLDPLTWVSNSDLDFLIERLPLSQRQVIVLRFVFDFTYRETAAALDRTEASVRMLQSRATAFLAERLEALGRGPSRRQTPATPWPRQATVLRARRFALTDSGPTR